MRRPPFALLLLLVACSKPPEGRFISVDTDRGLRIYQKYEVSGTLKLAAVAVSVDDFPVCTKFEDGFGGSRWCVAWGKGHGAASTKPADLPFKVRVMHPRYPTKNWKPLLFWEELEHESAGADDTVCLLTTRSLLAYAEKPMK